jgi:hypothetical protein
MASSNRQGAPRPNAALRQCDLKGADFTSSLQKYGGPGFAAPGARPYRNFQNRGYSFFA